MMNGLGSSNCLALVLGSDVGRIGEVKVRLGCKLSGVIPVRDSCGVSKSVGMSSVWRS